MAGHSPSTVKSYIAGAAITKRRIVKFGAADGTVVAAAAAADGSLGITTEVTVANGEPVDVVREGLADVEYGGAVTRGDPLTSDAVGRAVTAAPAAGVNNRVVGFAEVSGVLGDIGTALVSLGSIQG